VVDRTGNLSEVRVQRGIGGGCDEEAIRLIKSYPAGWQPARAGGKPISVQMSLPIRFLREMAQGSN
jgi:protein TonB